MLEAMQPTEAAPAIGVAVRLMDKPMEDGSAQLLRPGEVAQRLGVSTSWLYEAAKHGRIPTVRLGHPDGLLRFVEADLTAWLARARGAWRPAESSNVTLRRVRP
jgi:excisionase family DNA binding protein